MNLDKAREALKKYFGYDSFRPMQADIIQHIYDKKDALVLMPTGGGKSLCFQLPAITMPGTAIVVSPLISLMKDQVEGLLATGVKAAYLNSSLRSDETLSVESDFMAGALDLLYVSPEKLCSQGFLNFLRQTQISLFAIDEAHCVSAWGHDFRPEYTQLRFIKQHFADTPVLALTATADKLTRKDIIDQLDLGDAKTFLASFDRPNLSLEVRPGQKRREQIVRFIKERPNTSGIVYCLSRRATESLSAALNNVGILAAAYHAGLSADERNRIQEEFIKDDTPVICATIAFGMGIDKSNVRWIVHYNLPKNLENYYQEIGRAGRDGVAADTLLFYSYGDVITLRGFLGDGNSANFEVQAAKLERMQQYAESLACRRRILLAYFNEDLPENCGNCDNCKNPPVYFPGRVVAQKALSAVYRLRQSVGMNLLIDVLRGSARREVRERGYDKIKTYGAGRDYSVSQWQHYLTQLLNLGYLEIAHDQHSVLQLTPASERVLFGEEEVPLVQIATARQRQEKAKKKAKQPVKRERVRDELFEQLRELRRRLALEMGVPPYHVYSDATLEEMAARKPLNENEVRDINGVGEKKLEMFGEVFLNEIMDFLSNRGVTRGGISPKLSLEMYNQGMSIEDIAEKRQLKASTIHSHLAAAYEEGAPLDLDSFVDASMIEAVDSCLPYLEKPLKMKAIYEYLDERVSYEEIRWAITALRKSGKLAEDAFA